MVFAAVTRGAASVESQANSWFVIACLALAGLACIELSTSTPAALYTPVMLVAVIFVAIVGDRRMQLVIDVYALALIAVIGWVQGLRGAEFGVSMVIYASTVAVVNFICARTVGSLTEQINFTLALDSLNECFDEFGLDTARPTADGFAEIFALGLPYVASHPAGRTGGGVPSHGLGRPIRPDGRLARSRAPRPLPGSAAGRGDGAGPQYGRAGAPVLRPARRLHLRRRAGDGHRTHASRRRHRRADRRGRPAYWPPPSCGSPAGPTSSAGCTPRVGPIPSPGWPTDAVSWSGSRWRWPTPCGPSRR